MIEKYRIEDCIHRAYNANDLWEIKIAVCEFMQLVLNEISPPLDMSRPIYVKDDVDLKELCYYFEELDDRFINTSELGECITVMKDTREIWQYGYDGTVHNWWENGKLRQ